jgi:hypothetical protein
VSVWPVQLSLVLQTSKGQPKAFTLNHVDFESAPSIEITGANAFQIDGTVFVYRENPATSGGDWFPTHSTFEVKVSIQNGQISDAVTVTRKP